MMESLTAQHKTEVESIGQIQVDIQQSKIPLKKSAVE